jgi:hypothetical protein
LPECELARPVFAPVETTPVVQDVVAAIRAQAERFP